MSQRAFKTSEILATIHGFPAIMAAREGQSVIEAFDKLRDISPQIAGIEFGRGHMDWCALNQAMGKVVAQHFPELAAEPIPSSEYWNAPKTIDPDKVAELKTWVVTLEGKYGATLVVPYISAAVRRNLETAARQPRASL